jgi:hypothetical protein
MMIPAMRLSLALVVFASVLVSGCADHVPDQDLRILAVTTPAAKLSADDLWKDFQKDPAAARRQYFGQAIDVSAKITSFEANPAKVPHIFFGQSGAPGVRARLLDDKAAETVKEIKVGDRITLRCFCEGLDEKQDVVLKSCIRP